MATQKLNLTRDQLATFLKDHEQIKQFEALFKVVDQVAPSSDTPGIELQAGNAEASANEALSQLVVLAKDFAINAGNADQKAVQALDTLGRIANALEMLATAPAIQNNNSVATDYIDFPEDGPHVTQARRVQWNQDDGTMDVGLYGGSVLQVGQETMFYSKNNSGASIPNGTPVMFTGTVGSSGKLTFGLAIADGSVPAEYMMGVATQDIANNAFGYVTNFGLVRGFNTTGAPYGEVWADGDLLYFDPATPGAWTNVKPTAPSIAVPVAVVVNAGNGGSGSIFVRMELSESLSNLQDVYINGTGTPLAGQVLIYDATQQRWENHNLTAGTNVSIVNGDGSITINATDAFTGTVTSVAALTLGTTGTDLSSTVANPTTTPVITLNVPTASATNRGALSSTDWSTFNSKQAALVSGTNIKTVGGVTLLGAGDVSAPSFTTVTSSSTMDATTPNAGTTGGFRLRGNATSGTAYLQVTDSTATAEWGYASVVASGLWTWSGAFTATTITASTQFSGAGTGLTGAASGLSIGGSSASCTGNAATATNVAGSGITGSRGIPKAAMPAGAVLQVVSATYSTQVSTSSSTYADTGLTATITPTSSTSKILVIVSQSNVAKDTTNTGANIRLLRGASALTTAAIIAAYDNTSGANNVGSVSLNYLDSPATTSATTYKTQVASNMGSGTCYVQTNGSTSYITLMEIAA